MSQTISISGELEYRLLSIRRERGCSWARAIELALENRDNVIKEIQFHWKAIRFTIADHFGGVIPPHIDMQLGNVIKELGRVMLRIKEDDTLTGRQAPLI